MRVRRARRYAEKPSRRCVENAKKKKKYAQNRTDVIKKQELHLTLLMNEIVQNTVRDNLNRSQPYTRAYRKRKTTLETRCDHFRGVRL